MRGSEEVTNFPDPVPFEDDVKVQLYREGSDPDQKYLPSKLQDVSKQPHNLPFTPTAQAAKNVGLIVKCSECKKTRLMHSSKKLKQNE